MAVDLWWESPSAGTSSPRISFSHDLDRGEGVDDVSVAGSKVHVEPCGGSGSYSNNSHHEDEGFKFIIGNVNGSQSTLTEPSSADELFADGLIRPLQQIQPPPRSASSSSSSSSSPSSCFSSSSSTPPITNISHPPLPLPASSSATAIAISNRLYSNSSVEAPKSSAWGIKRSSSSHHHNTSTCKKISSFWSLPLLQRSRSTGSLPKDYYRNNNHHNHKQQHNKFYAPPSSSSSSPATASFRMFYYSLSEKPPLNKDDGGTWSKSSSTPLLNLPPSPHISISRATTNLFGFSSLFCIRNGKEKKKKNLHKSSCSF